MAGPYVNDVGCIGHKKKKSKMAFFLSSPMYFILTIIVLLFPPRAFFRSFVKTESLKGTKNK